MLALNPNAPEYVPPAHAAAATSSSASAGSAAANPVKREQRHARRRARMQKQQMWAMQAQQAALWYWYQHQAFGYGYPAQASSTEDEEDEFYGDYISDEHLQEMADCDAWVETMIQLDEEEREHLTAMALELAPAAGWHIEHNLQLVDGDAPVKPKPSRARQPGHKQRRTNRGGSKATAHTGPRQSP